MVRIKNIRLKEYDYKSNGYYFVTIVTNYRNKVLSNKEKIIEAELVNLTEKAPGLKIDYFVVMPDHVHVILILEDSELSLGEVIRRFKAKTSLTLKEKIWQPGFYEHVIRDDKALEKIREYIINNPEAQLLKFEQFYK